jgi:hypothetical protein
MKSQRWGTNELFDYRTCIDGILLQITQPKSHLELIRELSAGQRAETEEPRSFIEGVKAAVSSYQTGDSDTPLSYSFSTMNCKLQIK